MSQRDRVPVAQPMRLRVAAMLCALLVAVAGIAQAAHIHGDWLPSSTTQVVAHDSSALPGIGEDSCPLCLAMHSALPVAGFAVLVVALLLEIKLLLASSRKPKSLWYFAAFSRPPPTVNL